MSQEDFGVPRKGGHFLRKPQKRTEQEILQDILSRYSDDTDENQRQTEVGKQKFIEDMADLMNLGIKEILNKNKSLNFEDFLEQLNIHELPEELPVMSKFANFIKIGGKSLINWYNEYVDKLVARGQRRKHIREDINEGRRQLRQIVEFPFKSKLKLFERANQIKLRPQIDIDERLNVPDYQIKQLCKKFGRPYFSQYTGSWEIDLVFSMNPLIKHVSQIYLFCININTKYLVVYPIREKTADEILDALKKLTRNFKVRYIRGDGERGFTAAKLIQFYRSDQNALIHSFFIGNAAAPFTNHNRVVDSVIRTIRNSFGLDERAFANNNLMQQMVEIYNKTPHSAFNNYFTPEQVNENEDLEEIFIRKHNKQLQEQKKIQVLEGLHNFQPGNILMIHVDYSRTAHSFAKQRRNFNELAEFVSYVHGNVCCNPLRPFKELRRIEIPIYYCKYVCKNIEELFTPKFKDYRQVFLI